MMDSWQTLGLYMENYFVNIPDSDVEAIKQQADFIMNSARAEFKQYVESRGYEISMGMLRKKKTDE